MNYEDYVDYVDYVDFANYVDYVEEKRVESGLNYEGTKTHRAHPPLSSSLIQ